MKSPASPLIDLAQPGFSFASFRLDPDGSLWRGDTLLHLPPKELAALRILIDNAGRIVTPLLLRQKLWGDTHVSADSLLKCISSLRARLEPEDCIQTVYKRGYRFSAEVSRQKIEPSRSLLRLAVMPFVTGFTVPEHLGPTIAEETIARLTNLPHPVVAALARDSVFVLARRDYTALQIGQALKADFVLAGTLHAVGVHFRLRAEMVRVEDGIQVWVEDMLFPQSSIAGVETELVERLLMRLNVGGSQGGIAVAAAAETLRTPRNPEAYDLFLRGHHEWQTMQRHRMQDALQHLEKAVELDPHLSEARVDIVNVCTAQALYGFMAPGVAASLIRRVANSPHDAVQCPQAMLPALGWVSFHHDRDLPAALDSFRRAAHLPHELWTTHLRTMLALSRQRFDEALATLSKAIQQDPYSPWLQSRMAWAWHLAGEAKQSVDLIRQTLRLFPNHEGPCFYGSLILAFNGETEQATRLALELTHHYAYFDLGTAVHAYALVCDGKNAEARVTLERLQWLSRERFVLNSFVPAVHVALGDNQSALAELKIAADARCPWFFQMLADPRLKPLHGHPEFTKLQSILKTMEAAVVH
jgi:DNA-binding winged helix-turn-helix (wHTH) protein/tetratricopeptide (TPR) repeat protein